jgi:hypothetical protein
MTQHRHTLHSILAAERRQPVFPAARASARALVEKFGEATAGVLFYGSCLRAGEDVDKILDFYVIVDSYRAAYDSVALALWNAVLPPNVFYLQIEHEGRPVRAKYAVLSLAQFQRLASARTLNPSVWARFCQPCALAWVRDEHAEEGIAQAITDAVVAMVTASAPLMAGDFTPRDLWVRAFAQTYGAELRSETADKGQELYALFPERYDRLTAPALACAGFSCTRRADGRLTLDISSGARRRAHALWKVRRAQSKILNLARLIKASFTFDGGIDYLAWKIRRHSGVVIEITPWRRRHPVLTGIMLFWRLRRRGAFH